LIFKSGRSDIENEGKIAFYNRLVDMTDLKVIEIDFDTFSSHISRYRRLIVTIQRKKHKSSKKDLTGFF
jgi:hypothetical protein